MTVSEAYTKINNILDALRDSDITVEEAQSQLQDVQKELKDSGSDAVLTIPSEDELVDIEGENNYESSYQSSYESSYC